MINKVWQITLVGGFNHHEKYDIWHINPIYGILTLYEYTTIIYD